MRSKLGILMLVMLIGLPQPMVSASEINAPDFLYMQQTTDGSSSTNSGNSNSMAYLETTTDFLSSSPLGQAVGASGNIMPSEPAGGFAYFRKEETEHSRKDADAFLEVMALSPAYATTRHVPRILPGHTDPENYAVGPPLPERSNSAPITTAPFADNVMPMFLTNEDINHTYASFNHLDEVHKLREAMAAANGLPYPELPAYFMDGIGFGFANEEDEEDLPEALEGTGPAFTSADSSDREKASGHDKVRGHFNLQKKALIKVFGLQGEAQILEAGSNTWRDLREGMALQVGDQIKVGREGYVDIVYDSYFLNLARIRKNTIVEFISMQPLRMELSRGSLFSALDGLAPGDVYEVSTENAVATVRGTHFEVTYDPLSGNLTVATIPVPEDGHQSFIDLRPRTGKDKGIAFPIPEGFQVSLAKNQSPGMTLLEPIDGEILSLAKKEFGEMKRVREN